MPNNPLALKMIDGEPRIYDLDLAERLGFERPLNIRNLIKRNEAKLLKFGVLSTMEKTSGVQGGRPTFAYYPNRKQSIWLCMQSETDRAFDVQAEIVRVFDAYLNGALAAPEPSPVTRSRLYRNAGYLIRTFDAARDLPARQVALVFLRQLADEMGVRLPDIALAAVKPADAAQTRMEV